MKQSHHRHGTSAPLLLAAFFLLLTGCASTGMDRSEDASSSMQKVETDIKNIVVQLDATGSSLDRLIMPGQTDVKPAFETFSDNVAKIKKMESSFSDDADKMQARGKDYFEEWKKEGDTYKNSEIQRRSEQRRMELGEIYGRIAENSIGVKTAFKTYVSDVAEIQKYLSTDLTSKGIEAIAPLSKRVVTDGDNLKYAIGNVQSAIETAKSEMAPEGMRR